MPNLPPAASPCEICGFVSAQLYHERSSTVTHNWCSSCADKELLCPEYLIHCPHCEALIGVN